MLLAAAALSSAAQAASYQGVVTSVFPYNGKVMVTIGSGGYDGAAGACQTNGNGAVYWIDPSTPFGRSLMAVALAAKLSGRLTYATGDAVCANGTSGGGESLVGMDLKG